MDDLPLAAYSTGMKPDPRLDTPEVAATSEVAPAIDESAMAEIGPAEGEPAAMSATLTSGLAGRLGRPLPAVPEWLAKPREHLRDPRLLLSGVVAVGVILLVISLIAGGGGSGGLAAGASPSASAFVAAAPPPAGNASVEVKGKLAATYPLTGMTGNGPAVASRIEATWADASGVTLGLSGPASAGTRTTDATLVLTWTVLVDGAPVTFTSNGGECTVGMAVQPTAVSGSFVCKKLKSDDGKQVVNARGTYRT